MSRQEEEVRCTTWQMHSPDRSIQDVFFWRLAGPVAPTGKAIVHWIACINAIKMYNISLERYTYRASAHVCCIKIHAEMTEILQVKD